MYDWSKLVELHGAMVWQTAWRLVSNESDASDCFQKAFLSALELSRREPIANWRPLLKRLATARALDLLRERRRRSNRVGVLTEAEAPDRRAIDPLSAVQEGELLENLREALADLDPRQGQAFCLACLEDLSYDEIAHELGITANYVGVLLNRAKAELRGKLRAHAPHRSSNPSERSPR